MEIIPNIGLGPLRFGMSPKQVRSLLDEPESYEDWMGGNLNDFLLYKGLILGFDKCNAHGPLRRSKFWEAQINGREDVLIMGRRMLDWSRSSIIDRLEQDCISYIQTPFGGVDVAEWSLGFSFADNNQLPYLQMWRPATRWSKLLTKFKLRI